MFSANKHYVNYDNKKTGHWCEGCMIKMLFSFQKLKTSDRQKLMKKTKLYYRKGDSRSITITR